ncbi:hypothetical protein AN478_05795 [Thiohalorhabdus denitrificans]|uniref:Lipid kinase, YegS/Rv2252/BmrU family n=1 Tax=Thiohalorhabdus denitrificans TaxID=381306 RepID=A0A0P9CVI0_9GAMM|nr:diacylglycerol kinase family protein [Thiohalorhabdus denitrificans]KPV40670.1 hypothetical protein AN478_05795 [Thiohalorhabdus denitrificans]SCY47456.1 lipid kinase, YegS/Rv2252/BmrU family [Thiohalorhabdus denitrificans]
MRFWLLTNPHSGAAERLAGLDADLRRQDVEVFTPDGPEELRRLLVAAREQCDRLIIAGGDGTVHRVVNGMAGDFRHPALALLPLGTGNDLARTLALPGDPQAALELALTATPRPLDLLEVTSPTETWYGVNVCAGGFSAEVTEAVDSENKQAWGPLAYLRQAAGTVTELPSHEIALRFDNERPRRYDALNLIVANGRTAGGGITVAPRADPRDGLLEVVTVQNAPRPDLAPLVLRLLAGDYTNSDLVATRSARSVEVTSDREILFSTDGELRRMQEVRFRARPGALRFVAGPS